MRYAMLIATMEDVYETMRDADARMTCVAVIGVLVLLVVVAIRGSINAERRRKEHQWMREQHEERKQGK